MGRGMLTSHTGTQRPKITETGPVTVELPGNAGPVTFSFILDKKNPNVGHKTSIRLKDAQAISDNRGQRRLSFGDNRIRGGDKVTYNTTSRAIADEINKMIKGGYLKGVRRDVVVYITCPVPTCTSGPNGTPFRFRSDDSATFSQHMMDEHVEPLLAMDEPVAHEDEVMEFDELTMMTRKELNAMAANYGIKNTEYLPNKDAVIEAINDARARQSDE